MDKATVVNGVKLTNKRLEILGQWFDNSNEELIVSYEQYMDKIKNTLIYILCNMEECNCKNEIIESLKFSLTIQDDFKCLIDKKG